jgi:hypothetical protein
MHKTSYTHLSGGLTSRYQAHMPLERNNKILIITQVQCTVKFNTDNYAKRGAIRCREMSHTMCVYYMRCALCTQHPMCAASRRPSVRPERWLAAGRCESVSLFSSFLSLSDVVESVSDSLAPLCPHAVWQVQKRIPTPLLIHIHTKVLRL